MDDEFHVNPKWGITRLGGRQWFEHQSDIDEGLTHVGGYTFEALDDIITRAYGRKTAWDVWSVPFPSKKKVEERLPLIKAMLGNAVWANVRDSKLHMVFIPGTTTWGEMFQLAGVSILNEAKSSKRQSALLSRRALSHTTANLVIKEVAADAYATKDFGSDTEMLLDGTGLIRRSLFETMVAEWHDRVRDEYPMFRIDAMAARFDRALIVNLRAGTPLGLIKGNFAISDDDFMDEHHPGAAIVVPEGSYKPGMYMPEGTNFVTAEVQEWHPEVRTDQQTMIDLRSAFNDHFTTDIAVDFFSKEKEKVISGDILGHVSDIVNANVDAIRSGDGEMRDITIKWNAAEWVARGLDLRSSESMLRGVAEAKARVILQEPEGRPSKFKLTVPCSYYMQVVSTSAARMWGYQSKVTTGTARVWWAMKVIVISDDDFVSHYVRFGGHDLDDFFKVFFRTINGVRSLLIVRSPNELGGYGVFNYHEGDKYPVWKKANGDIIEFPEIKGRLPKPLDQAHADGDTVIYELDNDIADSYTHKQVTREEVWDKFVQAVGRKKLAGMLVNATMFWALVMEKPVPVGYGTLEDYIDWPTQGDLTAEAALSLEFLATLLIATAINSGRPVDEKFYVDRKIGQSVEKLIDAGVIRKPNLVSTGPKAFLSVRFRHVSEEVQKYLDFVKLKANEATPPEGLEELGALRLGTFGGFHGGTGSRASDAGQILRNFRTATAIQWNLADQIEMALRQRALENNVDREPKKVKLSDATWKQLYSDLVDALSTNALGRPREEHEVHNYVLSLALTSYTMRKGYINTEGNRQKGIGYCQYLNCTMKATGAPYVSKGIKYQVCSTHARQLRMDPKRAAKLQRAWFTDQPVTNPEVFPMYIAALERMGLCKPLGTDQYPYDAWNVECSNCHKTHQFRKATQYQKFMVLGLCKDCRKLLGK